MDSDASRPAIWQRRLSALGPAWPLALAAVAFPVIGGAALLGLIRQVGPWLRDHPAGPLVVLAGGTLAAGTCILPTYAISILAGWAFGAGIGLAVAMISLTGACGLGFAIARAAVKNHYVDQIDNTRPRWNAIRKAMVGGDWRKAMLIATLVRMAPIAPFGITNLLMASARCPVSAFLVGSGLGIIPQTTLLVLASSGLKELSFKQDPAIVIGGATATVLVLGVITLLGRRALDRVGKE